MNKTIEQNKKAWNYKAYEFFSNHEGLPEVFAKDILERPAYHLRRFIDDLGKLEGKKVLNPLGSYGKKAVAMGVLGAQVTLVDISGENIRYARELADHTGITMTCEEGNFLDYKEGLGSYDIVFLDGGILHYFTDINHLALHIKSFLKDGGRLILNDFHPFRKLFKERDIFIKKEGPMLVEGDYFESDLHHEPVSYEKFYDEDAKKDFPKCLLRFFTTSEIINAFAGAGMVIERFDELPRYDEIKNIPGNFTLIVRK